MAKNKKALLSVAVLSACYLLNAEAATEAERIATLEQQLNQQRTMMEQQQRMMEAMNAELQRLKGGEAAAQTATEAPTEEVFGSEPVPTVATAGSPPAKTAPKLSVDVYGFVMADAIYDFKRVDPDWADTLRVTTIPTESGTYGNDGDVVFSVRQSRLGIKGNYGDDITFKLEGELYGVGADQGQTTLRLRHAWASYKNFGMGQTWSNFMDIDIFPNTINYWSPTGMVF